MYKISVILVLSAILATSSFANQHMPSHSHKNKGCHMIAKACVKAGFIGRKRHHLFWDDCMKPILIGENVRGISIASNVAKDCRIEKIKELKRDLHDLQNANV